MLHIAGFITVCEAFLGMEPHMDFFRRLFSGQTLSVGNPPEAAPVGGFILQKKPSVVTRILHTSPATPTEGGTGSGSIS